MPPGALKHVPEVPSLKRLLSDAQQRSSMVRRPNLTEASLSPNKATRHDLFLYHQYYLNKLDKFENTLLNTLARLVAGFPNAASLHPFEQSLLSLSLPEGITGYINHLRAAMDLREEVRETGLFYKRQITRLYHDPERQELYQEAIQALTELMEGSQVLQELQELSVVFQHLDMLDIDMPTVVLIGAPGVGKTTLLKALSDTHPKAQIYPICVRGLLQGKVQLDSSSSSSQTLSPDLSTPDPELTDWKFCQLADTAALSFETPDPDPESPETYGQSSEAVIQGRQNQEVWTLSLLRYLQRPMVLFVTGSSPDPYMYSSSLQSAIRHNVKRRFPHLPWIDVQTSPSPNSSEPFDDQTLSSSSSDYHTVSSSSSSSNTISTVSQGWYHSNFLYRYITRASETSSDGDSSSSPSHSSSGHPWKRQRKGRRKAHYTAQVVESEEDSSHHKDYLNHLYHRSKPFHFTLNTLRDYIDRRDHVSIAKDDEQSTSLSGDSPVINQGESGDDQHYDFSTRDIEPVVAMEGTGPEQTAEQIAELKNHLKSILEVLQQSDQKL